MEGAELRKLAMGEDHDVFYALRNILDFFLRVIKKKKVKLLSRVQLFANPWTVAYQAPPIIGFSRQKYWSGLPFPSPEDFPKPAMNLGLLHCR